MHPNLDIGETAQPPPQTRPVGRSDPAPGDLTGGVVDIVENDLGPMPVEPS
jgi:hypothetical protein